MPIINKRQSLADIAVNSTGTVESLWSIAAVNNASISDIPVAGNNYQLATDIIIDTNTLQYLSLNNIQLATLPPKPETGIGYMQIGVDFIVS